MCSLAAVHDGSKILVVSRYRGQDKLSILSVPDMKEFYASSSGLPEGYGNLLETPVISNECDGLVAYQSKEGSVYVISELSSSEPVCEVFHLTKSCSILPSRSLVLVRRGSKQYALLMVAGEDDLNTELRLFDLTIDDGQVILNRVRSFSKSLAQIEKEIRPYKICAHESENTLLFIGGDTSRYSTISIAPFSVLDSQDSVESIHCEPLPGAQAVGVSGGFLVASRFGEIYSIPTKGASRLSLVQEGGSSISCMAAIGKSSVFVGSSLGDSVMHRFQGNNVKESEVLVVGTAPMVSLGDEGAGDVITCVSGMGRSSSLNRIKLSGIGTFGLEWLNALDFRPQNIFLAFGGGLLILSNSVMTRAFWISHVDSDEIKLSETLINLPSPILGVFDASSDQMFAVSSSGVDAVTRHKLGRGFLEIKRVWSSSENMEISSCGFCPGTNVLVLGSGRRVFTLQGNNACTQLNILEESEEMSCIAVSSDNLMAVGEWDGTVRIFQSSRLLHAQFASGKVPRNLEFIKDGKKVRLLLIGYSDGSLTILDSSWKCVRETEQVGLLSLGFAARGDTIILTGDRPSLISCSTEVVISELVDIKSGTVIPMREVAVSVGGMIWYIGLSGSVGCGVIDKHRKRESHVQRILLGSSYAEETIYPISVVVLEKLGLIAVAMTSLTPNMSGDEVVLYDKFQLINKKIACITAKDQFRISCMVGFGEESLVVGASKFSVNQGKLTQLKPDGQKNWTENISSILLRNDGSTAGPISAISACGRYVVACCLRDILVVKIHENSLVHVAQIESDFFITSIDSFGNGMISILVGDLYRSCSLFSFDPTSAALVKVARDLVPASTSAVGLLGDYALMGDELGNLYGMRIVEPSLARFERIEGVNIKSTVSAIKRVSPTVCWVANRMGAIFRLELVPLSTSQLQESTDTTNFDAVFEPKRLSSGPTVRHQIHSSVG